jgi:NAD-dependent dihydropyrimidine dehydrogenase PreA subunit
VSAARDTHDGLFINVEVEDSAAADAELATKLAEVCPVDIFTAHNGRVEIVKENLDECVLCELCINAAPQGAVRVIKLYSGETLPA